MTPSRNGLTVWTPLPPERNGIADYAHLLLAGLAVHYDCIVACEDWLGEVPPGIRVMDPALAHRHAGPRVLHQLGNNPGHGFVLRGMRRMPGVTTLHDPGLLYLYDSAGESTASICAGMVGAPPGLAAVFGRHRREHGIQTRANHLLFDLVAETLARSRAVVVHSAFARNRLRLAHGPAATAHVAVIPHLLSPEPMPGRAEARARLGIEADEFVVVTSGFATEAKRFDWLIEALDLADIRGLRLRWIHAGAERPEEYALSRAIDERPAVAAIARITGYLDAAALDAHIAAADLLVNLRFPSSGESSGSLARAFAAGTCCIVSDTAAYAELPRDAVVQIPLVDTVPQLAQVLRVLAAAPERAAAIGERARRWARSEMALDAVAARYRDVIEASLERPVESAAPRAMPAHIEIEVGPGLSQRQLAARLAGQQGRCQVLLAVDGLEGLAELSLQRPGLLAELVPLQARLLGARVQAAPRPGLLLDLEMGWPA